MAESQKGTSSANRKEKNSFLDDDIGNDFLTSWKTMSATKGDAMDFGFDTVSSGKNKAFNFEKLDMDFGLDGEFDKLSSFKVDMPDFVFSSPSKKVAKAKENSADESSSGKPQRKNNQFNFFDFNEMDNFDFESSLVVGKSSVKNKDGKLDISSDKTEQQSSKIQLSHDAGILNDTVAVKLPGSKGTVTPDVEAILSGKGHLFDKGEDCEKGASAGAPILPRSARSFPENVRTDGAETTDRHNHLSEKEIAMDAYSRHEKFESPGTSVAGVDSKRHASSDIETQNSCQGKAVDSTLGQTDHVNAEVTGISSYNETIPLNPYQLNTNSGSTIGWKNESGTDAPSETVNGDESAVGYLEPTESSISSLSRKSSDDVYAKDKNGNQTCTMEIHSAIQHRNVVNSNEAQTGVKSGANLVSVARELLEEDVLLVGGANNVTHVNNHRECFTSDVLPNDCKLTGTSQLHDEEVTEKNKALVSTCDKDAGNQTPTRFQVSSFRLSGKQQLKSSSPTSANPKCLLSRVESTRDTKIKSVEGNKVSPVRSPKKLTNLSLLTTSKTKGAAEKVSDSASQRHTGSLQNPRHEMKVPYISTSETAHPLESSKKKSLPNFSLKRKSYELPDSDLACLKPLKRFSSLQEKRKFQGPPRQGVEDKSSRVEESIEPFNFLTKASNIRDFEEPVTSVDVKESLRRVDGEKGTQKENHLQNNLNCIPVSVVHSPRETNVMDLELSLTIENDGSIERAEVYAKDLEDICNMLRKKQEEAKEILVRALVNNNNLLMLNHPIYEEKICKVQKFAVELMSKELKT